jgi:transposase
MAFMTIFMFCSILQEETILRQELILHVNFLNLPCWEIIQVEESEEHYIVLARPRYTLTACPTCGSSSIIGHGTDAQMVRDLPAQGKQVCLQIKRRRFLCKVCRKTCFEPLPDVEEGHQMTGRLVRFIERRALSTKRTFASIAEDIGIDPGTVRRLCLDQIARLDHSVQFDTPEVLGIDELHVLHQARGIITNITARTIIELLADRKQVTIFHYLQRLKHPERIRTVCIDLWKPYRAAVQVVLPGTMVVADKFHVLKLATTALETFRKELSANLTDTQRRTLKMHDRYLLLRRLRDLSPEDRFLLESWTRNYPLLGQAHQLKEDFFAIYDQQTCEQAEAAYFAWMDSVPRELLPVYQPLMLTVEEWGDEIFNHFKTGVTGGFVESANNIARFLNRLGRGYGMEVLRGRLLYGWEPAQATGVGQPSKGVPIPTLASLGEEIEQAELPTIDS